MKLMGFWFFRQAILAAFLAGVSCGVAGVWIFMMKISFLGVAISHAALAGALCAVLLNQPMLPCSFLFALAAAAILGPLSDKGQFHPETSIGIVFSVTLGLAFLFMGILPEARSQGLNFLWGNVLTTETADLILLAVTGMLVSGGAWLFFKEIQATIFSRGLAGTSGIAASAVFYLLLFLSGATVVGCLKSVGGLLVFSLLINPAAAAYQITYSLKKMYILACVFGVTSGWLGLLVSTVWHLPAGACTVLVSCFIFLLAAVLSPKRRREFCLRA